MGRLPKPRWTRRVIERVAEGKIREAMAEGVFDNLPGAGEPIPGLLDEPYDPDWWVKRWIERERLRELPEELRRVRAARKPS